MRDSKFELFLQDCEIVFHKGKNIPSSLKELRNEVFRDEKKFLATDPSDSNFDDLGTHILVNTKSSKETIGAIHVYPSEQGEFAEKSGASTQSLTCGATLTRLAVSKDYRGYKLGGLLLYLAMQEGRQWGKDRVFLFTEDGETATRNYIDYEELSNLNSFVPNGSGSVLVKPNTQEIAHSMLICFNQLPIELQDFIQPHIAKEAISTVDSRLDQFFKNPWFEAIYSETLTRPQYIKTLSNLHQFVRLTTRILARAVSLSPNKDLRGHLLEHLNGEIDHEVQLENDLKQINANVDYVKNIMIPNLPTQEFMVIQESLLAFNQDPLSYVAVPFSIEGFTARLDDRFITCLENCLAKWGVKRPARGVTFFKLHIGSDGGHDGHWENNKKIIAKLLDSELKLQKFLNIVHLTMNSLENSYSSYVFEENFEVLADTTETASRASAPVQVPTEDRPIELH